MCIFCEEGDTRQVGGFGKCAKARIQMDAMAMAMRATLERHQQAQEGNASDASDASDASHRRATLQLEACRLLGEPNALLLLACTDARPPAVAAVLCVWLDRVCPSPSTFQQRCD